ncbi:MAG: cysteine hydrolase family protein [Candidatus Dormibacteria bacterium]
MDIPRPSALVVVDVQRGFEDPAFGARNNPQCEANVGRLIGAYRRQGQPVVFVAHDSDEPGSPLAPGTPGNAFKEVVRGEPDLLVRKRVHSAFYGQPNLDGWLQERGIRSLAICGITTDHCCDTTARMASDLGYPTLFVLDATHTFDRRMWLGQEVAADQVAYVTAASLHREFAIVVATDQVLEALA